METFVIVVVLLVVGALLAFGFVAEFGNPYGDAPKRCPACKHEGLTRRRTPLFEDSKEQYECPHCGAIYRDWELH